MGNLGWSTTKLNQSNQQCALDCITFWEYLQQEALKRMSNKILEEDEHYKLEPGYETRARRIAATYAKIYLEQDIFPSPELRGRFYWMGLGAFASKTVAMTFGSWGTKNGYSAFGEFFSSGKTAINSFARGNFWLYMDVSVWHFAWAMSPASFNSCKEARNTSHYKHIKPWIDKLPWSDCLNTIDHLRWNPHLQEGFQLLPKIELVFSNKKYSEQEKYHKAEKNLIDHLLAIADHEQRDILQKITWDDEGVARAARSQRRWYMGWMFPDTTIVFSADYHVNDVTSTGYHNYGNPQHNSDNLAQVEAKGYKVYSEELPGTFLENEDSRMDWIKKAAEQYHQIMLDEDGREFLHNEIGKIATWGQSTYDKRLTVKSDSNDGMGGG